MLWSPTNTVLITNGRSNKYYITKTLKTIWSIPVENRTPQPISSPLETRHFTDTELLMKSCYFKNVFASWFYPFRHGSTSKILKYEHSSICYLIMDKALCKTSLATQSLLTIQSARLLTDPVWLGLFYKQLLH